MTDPRPFHQQNPDDLRHRADEIRQCGRPTGELGLKVAEWMNQGHAELWQWGLEHVTLPDGERAAILDVGCGSGLLLKNVGQQTVTARLFGLDHSGDMVTLSRQTCDTLHRQGRAEFFVGSVSKLPFLDATFDLVTAFETIYFWPDIEGDLREVLRVLQPGGTFLAVTESYDNPTFAEKNRLCMELAGGQVFSPERITSLLESVGFIEICIDTIEEKNWMTVVAKVGQDKS